MPKRKKYEEKCKEAELETLEERRKNQNISQAFKIPKGIDRTEQDSIFVIRQATQYMRQSYSPWNLTEKWARTYPRLHIFRHRVVEDWNALQNEVKNLENPNAFKSKLKVLSSEN
jgi:hypothetical protein